MNDTHTDLWLRHMHGHVLSESENRELLDILKKDANLASELLQDRMFHGWLKQAHRSARDSDSFVAQCRARMQAEDIDDQVVKTVKQAIRTEEAGRLRGLWIRRLLPLAAAASVAIMAGVWWLAQSRQPAGLGLRVVEVQGECSVFSVQYSDSGNTASGVGRPATRSVPAVVGLELRQGDRVVVAQGGKIGLKYDSEETTIGLDGTATFGLQEGGKFVRLEPGRFTCSAAPQTKPFRIQSPHALSTVVGTRFNIEVFDAKTALTVAEGKVQLERDGQTLLVESNQTAEASDQGLKLVAAAAMTGPLYLVVDLSGGVNARSYPVTYLDAAPAGGWTDEYKTTKLALRRIPAGTFTMGSVSPGSVSKCPTAGWRVQDVTLTSDFYIGVFEVTQRQWELVMGNRPSFFNNEMYYQTRPVEMVSYFQIRENPTGDRGGVSGIGAAINPHWPESNAVHPNSFMGKLRAKSGLAGFDLPTDAQWEYACRAGTRTDLNSGYDMTNTDSDAHMDAVGRYLANSGLGKFASAPAADTSVGTAKVGSYLPNAWGLYDMHGNVSEWLVNWQLDREDLRPVTDPKGPSQGRQRAIRGGSWYRDAAACSSWMSNESDVPGRRGAAFGYGFRVCCVPAGP